jgi:hypothetical protein
MCNISMPVLTTYIKNNHMLLHKPGGSLSSLLASYAGTLWSFPGEKGM